jgi:hypothetical protein
MSFKFEYLGKIDFIFKTNLGYESGKTEVKNLMQGYFEKVLPLENSVLYLEYLARDYFLTWSPQT